jgi:hypothetical protein
MNSTPKVELDTIEELGSLKIGKPHIAPMGKGLYEIRAKGQEGIAQILFLLNH